MRVAARIVADTALIVATVASIASCCNWTKKDTALELAVAASVAVDWWQSEPVFRYCAENNPVLGPCGDRVPPVVYFPLTVALHAGIAAALPRGWREVWQGAAIGAELNQAWMTYGLGWRNK